LPAVPGVAVLEEATPRERFHSPSRNVSADIFDSLLFYVPDMAVCWLRPKNSAGLCVSADFY
jgi:hypothetical protein